MENVKKEYKLEPDSELRFEIESKNKKISIEVFTCLLINFH